MMKNRKKNTVYLMLGILLVAELGMTFCRSGVVEGASERADRLKVFTTASLDDATIRPGDILDRNGEWIVRTTEDTEDGRTKTVYRNDYAFSQTVGYTGRRNLDLFAKSPDEVVGERSSARLMAFLDEDYWGENGIYSTTNIDGIKGQSAALTIDASLQEEVYSLLLKEFSSNKAMGSAVVMDAKTGEILADVSFPAYNFNDLGTAMQQMNEDAENTNLEPGYPVTYKNPMVPGSIFKVLMSVALIDHDMEDFTVENSSYTTGNNWTCEASPYYTSSLKVALGDTLDMETALNISSNVYYSKAALALGSEALNETAEKFMLSKDSSTLLLDFGNLHYNWDTDNLAEDVLAQTGFGQGRTELTTIHAAMITQAIANGGKMMKPYLVRELINADGKVVCKGESEVLSEATSSRTADMVTDMMRSTVRESCRLHQLAEAGNIFESYQVAGKTGTAENGDELSTNNVWFVSFAPANDPRYVVVVNQCRADKQGWQMMDTAASIYQYLFTEYSSQVF